MVKLTERQFYKVIKESVKRILEEGNIQKNLTIFYHGGNINDNLFYHGEIWLFDDPIDSYEYAIEQESPMVWKIFADYNELNLCSDFELYDEFGGYFEPIDGINDDVREFLDNNGYDGYFFALDNSTVYVLKDKNKIKKIEMMTQEEMKQLEAEY